MVPLRVAFDLSAIKPLDITLAVVGYVIVFIALVLLVWVFKFLPVLIKINLRRQLRRSGRSEQTEISDLEGNIAAAIAMALYLYAGEIHDEESGVITIKKISRLYSPWNSKIYSTNPYYRLRI